MRISRLIKISKKHSFFLFGARQTGKSTFIRELFPKETTLVYNLLKIDDFTRLQNNPDLLIEDIKIRDKKITHVVLDEVQKIPKILDHVHYLIEETANPPYFILTGSSARKLKRGQANLLGGRALNYFMAPLTHLELLKAEQQEICSFSLKKVLEYGGLPSIYLEEDQEIAAKLLTDYVDVYLKEEIKEEALVRNLGSFIEFLRFAAEENGNTLNFTKIASDIGVNASTVKEYFLILEDTLIAFFLRPYSKTVRKTISKSPKFYFFDTGVKRALAKETNLELIPKSHEFGKAFEHFIIKEFIHLSKYLNQNFDFSYYRTESGAEVDLIVTTPKKEVYAIEIKATNVPRKQELRGLYSFKEICPKAKLCCVSLSPNKYQIDEIMVYPWQEIFKELGLN